MAAGVRVSTTRAFGNHIGASFRSTIAESSSSTASRSSSTASIIEIIPKTKSPSRSLGAVAEFERAKIIERMMRGKVHRLRKGEMIGGLAPFGYEHVKKTATAPATLAIKEPEASTVRTVVRMYTEGVSIIATTRWLQRSEIKTRLGKTLWHVCQVRAMLECRTYTGNRYYRPMNISDDVVPKHKRGSAEHEEVICVKVPAIISHPDRRN
jgi:hypothetical protein